MDLEFEEEYNKKLHFRFGLLELIGSEGKNLLFKVGSSFGILISQKEFLKYQKEIFKQRADYYKVCKHFCGADSSIVEPEDFSLLEDWYVNHYDFSEFYDSDEDKIITIELPVYKVTKVSHTETEHG